MTRKMCVLLAIFGLMFLSGCSTRIVDFTAISTKNVSIPTSARGDRVTGQDCVPVFIGPLGIPNMKTAIDKAIETSGAEYDALIDGVVYSVNQSFLIGRQCFKVEGTPVNTKAVSAKN